MDAVPETLRLLRRWQAGDAEALHPLIARHLEWIRVYVRKRLGDRLREQGDSQDFVHEAVVDVLRYGPRFEVADEDRFRGLLARIVENNLRDAARSNARARRVGSDTVIRLDAPAGGSSPSQRFDQEERVAWVRLAIEFLNPEHREVLWLREYEGRSFADIAARIGVSEDAARMRFTRALPRLAAKIAELRRG